MKDLATVEGWAAFAMWTVATFAAACLGTSLTWDGSYYLAATLELGHAFVDHHRYANILLLEPALFAYRLTDSIRAAAAVHGLLCGLTGILCFLGVLLTARKNPQVRLWLLAGIVLSPLPGMIDATMEITPAMQTMFFAVSAAWFLPIRPGLIVAGFACLWMGLMHPIAAPLLAFAAVAVWLGDSHRRSFAWLFGIAALFRAGLVGLGSTAYERAQFDAGLARVELEHMYSSTPWWLVPAGACLLLLVSLGKVSRGQEWVGWLLLATVAGWWMSDPVHWSGALNYRKFAMVFVLPFLIPAALAHRSGARAASGSILGCTLLASVTWFVAALSWQGLMWQFQEEMSGEPRGLVYHHDVEAVKDTALVHWGATPLSLLLLGKDSERVYIAPGVSVREGKLILFPGQVELPSKAVSATLGSSGHP